MGDLPPKMKTIKCVQLNEKKKKKIMALNVIDD